MNANESNPPLRRVRNSMSIKQRIELYKTFMAGYLRSYGKQKIFGVGLNKTGTTSFANVLRDLGIVVAPQDPAERLINDWARRDFRRLIHFCTFFQAFQDVPFSCPFTYHALDNAFPGSKFVLTVRQTPGQWSQSLTRFHSKAFAGGAIPQEEDLRAAQYCYPGYLLDFYRGMFGSGNTYYDPEMLCRFYEFHNNAVIEYFRHRPADLLILDVSKDSAMPDLCRFLGKPLMDNPFPWKNKTDETRTRGRTGA